LCSKTGVRDVIGRLRESLDDNVLYSGAVKRFSSFPISSLDTFEAKSIVGEISLETFDDPGWNFLHKKLCNL